eukprot:TRINITY_DN6492_c0_g1_i1.p1 TRINITY_DN6492_c0_g1~~TRINITY_DN6492_c0_g1_i1.p1  ORF type:complete len:758 (+),score=173.18 TRINITY_DN6492_c0_g1_i1:75-2348(+)
MQRAASFRSNTFSSGGQQAQHGAGAPMTPPVGMRTNASVVISPEQARLMQLRRDRDLRERALTDVRRAQMERDKKTRFVNVPRAEWEEKAKASGVYPYYTKSSNAAGAGMKGGEVQITDEPLLVCFIDLPHTDLLNVQLVCRSWNNLVRCNNGEVWKRKCMTLWVTNDTKLRNDGNLQALLWTSQSADWKRLYFFSHKALILRLDTPEKSPFFPSQIIRGQVPSFTRPASSSMTTAAVNSCIHVSASPSSPRAKPSTVFGMVTPTAVAKQQEQQQQAAVTSPSQERRQWSMGGSRSAEPSQQQTQQQSQSTMSPTAIDAERMGKLETYWDTATNSALPFPRGNPAVVSHLFANNDILASSQVLWAVELLRDVYWFVLETRGNCTDPSLRNYFLRPTVETDTDGVEGKEKEKDKREKKGDDSDESASTLPPSMQNKTFLVPSIINTAVILDGEGNMSDSRGPTALLEYFARTRMLDQPPLAPELFRLLFIAFRLPILPSPKNVPPSLSAKIISAPNWKLQISGNMEDVYVFNGKKVHLKTIYASDKKAKKKLEKLYTSSSLDDKKAKKQQDKLEKKKNKQNRDTKRVSSRAFGSRANTSLITHTSSSSSTGETGSALSSSNTGGVGGSSSGGGASEWSSGETSVSFAKKGDSGDSREREGSFGSVRGAGGTVGQQLLSAMMYRATVKQRQGQLLYSLATIKAPEARKGLGAERRGNFLGSNRDEAAAAVKPKALSKEHHALTEIKAHPVITLSNITIA